MGAQWSQSEDMLLCSIIHEFGNNYHLAAEILGGTNRMQGLFRRHDACRAGYLSRTVLPLDPSPLAAL